MKRSFFLHTPEEDFRRYVSPISEQLEFVREKVSPDDDLIPGSALILEWLLVDCVSGLVDHFKSCGSPIERMFLSALLVNTSIRRITLHDEEHQDCGLPGNSPIELLIEIQKPVSKYRVDFFLHASECGGPCSDVVVECDGHDFHERTKEQASKDRSRDRILQSMGYPVLRYTGSEIWADSYRCADEALRFVESLAFKALDSWRTKR